MSEKLHGNPYKLWSDEELKEAMDQIYDVMATRRQVQIKEKKKTLNINGITVKDFVVMYAPIEEGEDPMFQFFIARDGKLHDIYYDNGTHDFEKDPYFSWHSWWPTVNDNDEPCDPTKTDMDKVHNAAFGFIPSGFAEAMENCYEYGKGKTDEAIEVLKEHGFETIIECKVEDQGYFQEVYSEWLNENKQKKVV